MTGRSSTLRPHMEDAVRLAIIIAGSACAGAAQADTPTLTVYTYDSFVSDWGPGPQITEAFEAECDCRLDLRGVGDGAALLAQLRLEGDRTDADIVLGLDTNLMARARETGLLAEHDIAAPALDMPLEWDDPVFLPYDWGYFAFVHDRDAVPEPPGSFRALIDSDLDIVIQDPRSSTPGLGLLMWVEAAHGDAVPEIWAGLAERVLTVTSGWSEAYGLFTDGEADMVLSYTTSPAYHMIAEEDDSVAAAPFEEGHYMQIEVAAMLESTDQPDLARDFLGFMLSEGFQSVIPTTNWMYPAILPEDGLPAAFDRLIEPAEALHFDPEVADARRDPALDAWLEALSR